MSEGVLAVLLLAAALVPLGHISATIAVETWREDEQSWRLCVDVDSQLPPERDVTDTSDRHGALTEPTAEFRVLVGRTWTTGEQAQLGAVTPAGGR